MSHNPLGLHGLLRDSFTFYIKWHQCSHLTSAYDHCVCILNDRGLRSTMIEHQSLAYSSYLVFRKRINYCLWYQHLYLNQMTDEHTQITNKAQENTTDYTVKYFSFLHSRPIML
jgi:hypothetical protein